MVRCDGATVSFTFPGQQIGECDQIVAGTVFVTGVSPQALGALGSGATLRHLCVRTARVAEGLPPPQHVGLKSAETGLAILPSSASGACTWRPGLLSDHLLPGRIRG